MNEVMYCCLDQSQYIVCYGAESVARLVEHSFQGRGSSGRGYRGNRGYKVFSNGRGRSGSGNRGFWNQRGKGGRGYVNAWRGSRSGYRGSAWHGRGRGRGNLNSGFSYQKKNVFWTEEENNEWSANMMVDDNSTEQQDECHLVKQCPEVGGVCVIGDSFAFRMAKVIDTSIEGKFNLCKGGLTLSQLKENLLSCPNDILKKKSVILFIGMNDVNHVNESDWDGGLYSVARKLESMNVEKLHVCSLPVLPGKLTDKIQYFNQKL
ncbi:Protein virilizer-like protein [Frankliniella fusca]|uniref:Protein virilizer-like protein n=1 Tax=Frankliniella fusca TaxID=407009 RepID=A0AAE1LAQ5_9NEOP|nr:Protein virilizer-like protein [Frankliniella fusca]